jgi:alkanesulfonate monooxygenase SsuD/methylene tetrahydromethanopterin reductase-like flavin-dependent oxidoreductase (luciferase family)
VLMKFGICNISFVYPAGTGNIWRDTKAYIQHAERDGFDSFCVMDHFYQISVHGSVEEPFLDAWIILHALAVVTSESGWG